MFKNFNKLIPCSNIIKNNMEEIIKQIPISERWECRDFNVKNKKNYPVSSHDSYSLIVPIDKQYVVEKKDD
jgi:hypothetical protein